MYYLPNTFLIYFFYYSTQAEACGYQLNKVVIASVSEAIYFYDEIASSFRKLRDRNDKEREFFVSAERQALL
jgi:hypothetical protein